MGLHAAGFRRQRHHQAFRQRQAAGIIEIGAHAIRIEFQPDEHLSQMPGAAAGKGEEIGDGLPFSAPAAGRALMLGFGGHQHGRDKTGDTAMIGADGGGADRIALVRHGR